VLSTDIPAEAASDIEKQFAAEVSGSITDQPCLLEQLQDMAQAAIGNGDNMYCGLPNKVCFFFQISV
jgi:hypothetical protein